VGLGFGRELSVRPSVRQKLTRLDWARRTSEVSRRSPNGVSSRSSVVSGFVALSFILIYVLQEG